MFYLVEQKVAEVMNQSPVPNLAADLSQDPGLGRIQEQQGRDLPADQSQG